MVLGISNSAISVMPDLLHVYLGVCPTVLNESYSLESSPNAPFQDGDAQCQIQDDGTVPSFSQPCPNEVVRPRPCPPEVLTHTFEYHYSNCPLL